MPQNFNSRIIDTQIFAALMSFSHSSNAYWLSASMCRAFWKSKVKISSLVVLAVEHFKWLYSSDAHQTVYPQPFLPLVTPFLCPPCSWLPSRPTFSSYVILCRVMIFKCWGFPKLRLQTRCLPKVQVYPYVPPPLGWLTAPQASHTQTCFSLLFQ